MSVKAFSGFREKRWRVALERQELVRLASMLDVIRPELSAYQQSLAEQWQAGQASNNRAEVSSERLKLFVCLESLLPVLDELVRHGAHDEEKSSRVRITLAEEEMTKLRAINHCARHLPDLPALIAWSEFAQALAPILAALDRSAFDQLAALVTPKPVNCTIDDFKRGRTIPDEPTDSTTPSEDDFDGLDWNT